MLKVVMASKYSLSLLGDVNANMEDIIKQATAFMCQCYNVKGAIATTEAREARIKAWTTKTGRNCNKSSKTVFSTTYFGSF